MKKTFAIILIIALSSIQAQDAGKSGLSFLKFSFGARNAAMGDLGASNSPDVSALFYNPAMLSELKEPQVQFTHNEWIQDVRSENIGAFARIYGIPLALGVNTTSVADIPIRQTPSDVPQGTFNANYFSTSLSTGFSLFENVSVGATVKYLYEGMLSDEASGWGFDVGTYYMTPLHGLSIGAVVRNMGSMDKLRQEKTKLPTELRIGGNYGFAIPAISSYGTAGVELLKYSGQNDTHINFGGELIYEETLALRAGYQTGFDARGFSAGLGIIWESLRFDYAFVPFGQSLGSAHLVTLGYRF